MSYNPSKILIWSTLLMASLSIGCSPTKPLYLNDVGDLSTYMEQATKVEYPDVEPPTLDEVTQSYQPMTVLDPDFTSYLDLTLEDAISYALSNSKVIRGFGTPSLQGTRVSPGQDGLANGPAAAATTYNIAIRETEPGFIGTPGQIAGPGNISTNTALDGNQGVESALAEFDAQLTSSFTFTKTDEPRNSQINILNSNIFQQDQLQWQTEVAKKSANGTQIFFRNVNQWTENNNPLIPDGLQAIDSFYRASFEAEVRQPLLRGRGAFINRMSIVISRISTDQEIANLEATLQNMVTNVEIRYWDLYCAYRGLDSAKTGRDAALETWRIVKDQYDEGAEVNIQQLAQASEQYHFFEAQVIDAYNTVLDAEGKLRYLFGWASTDGRFVRPIDEPVMAPVEFDWTTSLCEALTYRPELRQERWEVKKRELALAYSKNGLLPELNVTFLYRWLGLGNRFGTAGDNNGFPDADSGALNELFGGDFQELQFRGNFGVPIGFRRELANVRNAQLKLAREIARVEDMELDITKELSESMRALAANQLIMLSSFNRWKDTTVEEEHFERLQDAGVETLDVALDAQRRRSQAEVAFYTAMCEYNKVIALIHRRKGTILPYSGVHFNEGPWPGKAYIDASEHARRRGASQQLNYGWTRPGVISRGENWPTANNTGHAPTGYAKPAPETQTIHGGGVAPIYDPYSPTLEGGYEADSMNGQPDSMDLQGQPYYEMPLYDTPSASPFDGLNAPINSTPQGSSSRNAIPKGQNKIRQVSYTESIEASNQRSGSSRAKQPVKRKTNTQKTNTQKTKTAVKVPVAILKPKYRNPKPAAKLNGVSRPQRDLSPQPVKRLRAAATKSVPDRESTLKAQTTAKPQTKTTSKSLAWEKLGLTRPQTQSSGITARIKTN